MKEEIPTNTTLNLMRNIVIGIWAGLLITPVVGIICVFLYDIVAGGILGLFYPVLWLFAIWGGIEVSAPWIPAGVIVGAGVGVYKTHKSNTASRFAVFLASIVLLGTLILWGTWRVSLKYNANRVNIGNHYKTLYESFRREDYEPAYALMTPKYREEHTIEELQSDFSFLRSDWDSEELHPNYSVKVKDNRACLYPDNKLPLPSLWWAGPEFELELVEGEWYFTGRYDWHMGEEGVQSVGGDGILVCFGW